MQYSFLGYPPINCYTWSIYAAAYSTSVSLLPIR